MCYLELAFNKVVGFLLYFFGILPLNSEMVTPSGNLVICKSQFFSLA